MYCFCCVVFFFKQKTAYELRIGDWRSDVCSSDLTDELVGRSFNKAALNRDLQAVIDRSKGSLEFKHQNISAVLLGLGQPWIEGYKPAANFQNALVDGVLRWLEARTEWLAPDRLSRAALNEIGRAHV